MLINLNLFLGSKKKRDIQKRYDGKKHSDKVGAEAELALMWAFHQEGFDISVEPFNNGIPGGKNPDLLVTGMVDKPIIAEITTVSGSEEESWLKPNSLASIDKHNTLNKTLRRKNDQLKNIAYGPHYKVVFIWDGGWPAIRDYFLTRNDRRERFGDNNLTLEAFCRWHRAKASFDCVCVICPYDRYPINMTKHPKEWGILTVPDRVPFGPDFSEKVKKSLLHLPNPRLEPYQVKNLNEQGVFNKNNDPFYRVGTIIEGRKLRVSIGLVQQFLAGEITLDQFESFAFGSRGGNARRNFFKLCLDRGEMISSVKIIPCSYEYDDDILEIEFKSDISLKKFKDLREENE